MCAVDVKLSVSLWLSSVATTLGMLTPAAEYTTPEADHMCTEAYSPYLYVCTQAYSPCLDVCTQAYSLHLDVCTQAYIPCLDACTQAYSLYLHVCTQAYSLATPKLSVG